MNLFKRKKIFVIYYVNVMGVAKENIKSKLGEYADQFSQFKDDKRVKEMFIPTNGETRVEFVKL